MKKRICATIITLSMLLGVFVMPVCAAIEMQASSSEIIRFKRSSDVCLLTKDQEQNMQGPQDYTIDNGNIYVFNSANNSLYEYQDKSNTVLDFNRYSIKPIRISVDNEIVYTYNNDNTISVIEKNTINNYRLESKEIDESITDFQVNNGKIYIVINNHTYVFELIENRLKNVLNTKGKYISDEMYYKTVLLTDDTHSSFGYGGIVQVFDDKGNEKDQFSYTSSNLVAGIQFLGYNSLSERIIKVFECQQHSDGTIKIEESIRTIDNSGYVNGAFRLNNQSVNFIGQTKNIEGVIYQFDYSPEQIGIFRINTEYLDNASQFISSLSPSEDVKNYSDENENFKSATVSSITRNRIMTHAAAYHVNFTWTCSSANLYALTGWTKPHYISTAGTYSFMPYCWGGFNNTTQFAAGMSSGGRPGNINCPSSGYVSNTYGVDCSGYVSRCWGLSTKYSTYTIGSVSSTISYSSLLRGDAINKYTSHIVLYDYNDGSGSYVLYEATTLNNYDRVSHTTRSISSLQNGSYVPIRYNGVV